MAAAPPQEADAPVDAVNAVPPSEIEIEADNVGLVIGRGGSTIRRLIESTGCKIEVPRDKAAPRRPEPGAKVLIQLQGSDAQRLNAIEAIEDIVAGGEVEDHAIKAEGGVVIPHNIEGYDRQQWLGWRLVPTEKELSVRMEVGKKAVRVFAEGRKRMYNTTKQRALERVEELVPLARELAEVTVNAQLEHEPENAGSDPAIGPFIDQYGVLVRVPRPENGAVPIRIVGPEEASRDVAALLEARYVQGHRTASVMQAAGQIQGMTGQMKGDFDQDLEHLMQEFRVEVHQTQLVLWISGANAEQVSQARSTLQEVLQYYFPDHFFKLDGLKTGLVEKLSQDPELRAVCAKGDMVLAYDRKGGSVWICGTQREAVKKRINFLKEKYEAEHFELDLEDYGAAMWLLGPAGSGAWLARMQNDSGAKIQVNPNQLKVWAEGTPGQIIEAKKLVQQAMEQLAVKKAGPGPTPKVKQLLTEPPPHMKAVMEKLAKLEAEKIARQQAEKWGVPYQPTPPDDLGHRLGGGPAPAEQATTPSAQPPADSAEAAAPVVEDPVPTRPQRILEWDPATGQMVDRSIDLPTGPPSTAAATEDRSVRPRLA